MTMNDQDVWYLGANTRRDASSNDASPGMNPNLFAIARIDDASQAYTAHTSRNITPTTSIPRIPASGSRVVPAKPLSKESDGFARDRLRVFSTSSKPSSKTFRHFAWEDGDGSLYQGLETDLRQSNGLMTPSGSSRDAAIRDRLPPRHRVLSNVSEDKYTSQQMFDSEFPQDNGTPSPHSVDSIDVQDDQKPPRYYQELSPLFVGEEFGQIDGFMDVDDLDHRHGSRTQSVESLHLEDCPEFQMKREYTAGNNISKVPGSDHLANLVSMIEDLSMQQRQVAAHVQATMDNLASLVVAQQEKVFFLDRSVRKLHSSMLKDLRLCHQLRVQMSTEYAESMISSRHI